MIPPALLRAVSRQPLPRLQLTTASASRVWNWSARVRSSNQHAPMTVLRQSVATQAAQSVIPSNDAATPASLEPTTDITPSIAELLLTVAAPPQPNTKIALGISGGVDSAVSAWLLQQRGWHVVPVHMRNWDEVDETGVCSGQRDADDAKRVCKTLGIGTNQQAADAAAIYTDSSYLHTVDFSREYWHSVFSAMLQEYSRGVTPNPDVLCNREIKFDVFLKYCRQTLGVDYVATGHYARVLPSADQSAPPQLHTAIDASKDQSYFLAAIRSESLRNVVFPLGYLFKHRDVRRIASMLQLPVASKRDSMGLCFIGPRRFPQFLRQYLQMTSGSFVCIDGGKQLQSVGTHSGAALYTVGQQCRISGAASKYYVVGKHMDTNTVLVTSDAHHAWLYSTSLTVERMSWLSGSAPTELRLGLTSECHYKVRSTGQRQNCVIRATPRQPPAGSEAGDWDELLELSITLDISHHAVAIGQTIVLYQVRGNHSDNDTAQPAIQCLGGGVIASTSGNDNLQRWRSEAISIPQPPLDNSNDTQTHAQM